MAKCPKELISAIEALQSLPPGHPKFQWPPLRYPEDSVKAPVSTTAPSGAVPSTSPAVRVTVPHRTPPHSPAPASALLTGTKGAGGLHVGRSVPANEPPLVQEGGGRAAFDEHGTRAFVDSRKWGRDLGTLAGLAIVFTSVRRSHATWATTIAAPAADDHASSNHPWLPPPPSPVAQGAAADHVATTDRVDPSRVVVDARQASSLPRVRKQAVSGVAVAKVHIPVSDSSPTPLPTTTGAAATAPPELTGSLDPLYMRNIAVAQSVAPASPRGLLDVEILGGRATTGRGRGTYRQQAVTSYYSDPPEHAWHLQIMRFTVESGMTFNCVKLESFKRMFTMIIPPRVPRPPTPRLPTYLTKDPQGYRRGHCVCRVSSMVGGFESSVQDVGAYQDMLRGHGGGGDDEGGDNRGQGGSGGDEEGDKFADRGVNGGGGGGVNGCYGGGSDDNRSDGGGGDDGAHGRGGSDDAHDRVEQYEDDGPVRGRHFVLKWLRHKGRQDNSIKSRVRSRRLQTLRGAAVTEASIVPHEQVAVSKDSLSDKDFIPSDADMKAAEHGFIEAPTTSAATISALEERDLSGGSSFSAAPQADLHLGPLRSTQDKVGEVVTLGGGEDIQRGVGGGHTDNARPHLMTMRSTPPHPHGVDPAAQGLAASTALPTVSFYDGVTRDRRAGDEAHALAYGPTHMPAGTRSIGRIDGGYYDSMRAYEERHGRLLRAKTLDVPNTRTTTARLSRTRTKETGTSIPYHRRRHLPAFNARAPTRTTTAGTVPEGGTGGGGSTTILQRSQRGHDELHESAAGPTLRPDDIDRSGPVENRRGAVVIYHDESTTAVEAGETTGTDDSGDSDYVPRGQTTDGDDGVGRRGDLRNPENPEN
ncbi:hypothetical protein CBR_g12967 [Chara braunii]|uniref:Uncharacterized protein n=1 Tax=Chara braunii TaxID=69332 RepID=A0A388KT87_CHABU|nr:hypothetical protein CBR_g12967 [Chara braunii]|eukprot:GBG73249.1 hypothetical protein CBR_g12967 [Chara braunii]